MRQILMVDSFAFLFNCTLVFQVSDSMKVPFIRRMPNVMSLFWPSMVQLVVF